MFSSFKSRLKEARAVRSSESALKMRNERCVVFTSIDPRGCYIGFRQFSVSVFAQQKIALIFFHSTLATELSGWLLC